VKFLIDHQLPPALAQYLRTRGFDCQHVLDAGLAEALDLDICRYAEAQEPIVVSKDEDFLYLAGQSKVKVRLLWVRLGNCRTSALLAAFERLWPSIESALSAGERIVEIR
jgi:predicted nuclease of predicted toxin-antitoxin system